MMKPLLTLATILVLGVPAMAQTTPPRAAPQPQVAPPQPQAAPPSKGMPVGDTAQFATKAAMSNMLEIETSRLALEKTKSAEIREFAQTMITDHTKATQELDAIVKEGNASFAGNKLDNAHQQEVDRLKKADATKFDGEYVALQVKAHDDAVALFRTYAQSGTDAKLKAFAQKMLPDLERHASLAKKLPQQ